MSASAPRWRVYQAHGKSANISRPLALSRLSSTHLARSMLLISLDLRLCIPSQARETSRDGPTHSIGNALAHVADLPGSLSALTCSILLPALVLQTLVSNQPTDSLLRGADGLVPASLLALWVVGRYAGAGDGDAANRGPGFGGCVLGVGLCLLFVGFSLVGSIAGEGAERRLS